MSLNKVFEILKGGSGSGHFGHSGIPGHYGGSKPKRGSGGGGTNKAPTKLKKPKVETKKPEPEKSNFKEVTASELEKHYKLDELCTVNPLQCQALNSYTDLEFDGINSSLRQDKGKSPIVGALDSAFNIAPKVPDNIITRRVIDKTVLDMMTKGATFQDKGFTSTTISKDTDSLLKNLTQGGGYVMEIRVPKGTKGIYVDSISENKGEQELLLNRGTKFKIIEKSGNSVIAEVQND